LYADEYSGPRSQQPPNEHWDIDIPARSSRQKTDDENDADHGQQGDDAGAADFVATVKLCDPASVMTRADVVVAGTGGTNDAGSHHGRDA